MRERIQSFLISRPVVSMAILFVVLILICSVLLFLFELWGINLSFADSVFTSTSASTLTGLVVVPTHTLSFPSQIVVLVAIQSGALMTFVGAYVILKIVGYRGKAVAELVSQVKWNEIKTIILFSLLVELAAAAGFYFLFRDSMSTFSALYFAVFHAVSAYCNAGFFLFSDNFYSFSANPLVLGIIMTEVVLGAVGFVVILDMKLKIFAFFRRENAPLFRIETRIVFIGTIVLLLLGFGGFWLFESGGVLAGKSTAEAALISIFESVNARNSGLSSIDLSGMQNATYYLYMILMYIGAGSGSVSGGVKITTLAIIFLFFVASLRGRSQVIVWGSEIPHNNIWRAMKVLVIFAFISLIMAGALLAVEPFEFEDVLFELISASGTVGFSTGITSSLSTAGKIIVMLSMFVGRLGPLTLTYFLARGIMWEIDPYTYKEEVSVG